MSRNYIPLIISIIFSIPLLSQEKMVQFSVDLSTEYDHSTFSADRKGEQSLQINGTKGFFWTPAQYLAEIPVLSSYGMNFLATCYGSFYKDYKFEKGNNNWWEPFNTDLQKEWKAVIEKSKEHEIMFCFGMNPMLYSAQPLDTESEDDFKKLLAQYRWFQENGVKWFYLALDDLHMHKGMKVDGKEQALFTNKLYEALLKHDPETKMIFCPTWYWGSTTKDPDKKAYLLEIAEYLRQDIPCFWTGNDIVATTVDKFDALEYKSIIGHELILWDNYPVNDFNNSLHLGPITGRDPRLNEVLYGIMGNPMRDNKMNRLPLFTMADYAHNPQKYNPSNSIVQAIKAISENSFQEEVLKKLILFYPGDITYRSKTTRINCARVEFESLFSKNRDIAAEYLQLLIETEQEFDKAFPNKYDDTKNVIKKDIQWMTTTLSNKK